MMFSQCLLMEKPDIRGLKDAEDFINKINDSYNDYYFRNRYKTVGLTDEEASALNIRLYKAICMQMTADSELMALRVKLHRLDLKELRLYQEHLELFRKQYRNHLDVLGRQFVPRIIARASKFSDIIQPYRIDVREALTDKVVRQHIEHPELIILAYSAEILALKAAAVTCDVLDHIPSVIPQSSRRRFMALDYRPMAKMLTTFRKRAEEICGKVDLHHTIKLNNAVKKIMEGLDILEQKEREYETNNYTTRHR